MGCVDDLERGRLPVELPGRMDRVDWPPKEAPVVSDSQQQPVSDFAGLARAQSGQPVDETVPGAVQPGLGPELRASDFGGGEFRGQPVSGHLLQGQRLDLAGPDAGLPAQPPGFLPGA